MYYIKVNSSVVLALNLRAERTMLADGNFLLLAADLEPLNLSGSLFEQTMAVGGTILTPVQAKMEKMGRATFPLPTATDARFVPQMAPRAVETYELADFSENSENSENSEPLENSEASDSPDNSEASEPSNEG